jgi:signal transduction histidine kinase
MRGAFALEIEDNGEARAAMDAAVERLRADIDEQGGQLEEAYTPVLDALGELDAIRAEVDAVPPEQLTLGNVDMASNNFDRYTELMELLFAANRQVTYTIDDEDLRRGVEIYDLSAQQTDVMARLVRALIIPRVTGDQLINQGPEVRAIAEAASLLRSNSNAIRVKAQGDYAPLAEELFADGPLVDLPELADEAIATGTVDVGAVATASTGTVPELFHPTVFRDGVAEVLGGKAEDARAEADGLLQRYVILATVAVLLAGLATWLVSRSITRPLRSLTRQARSMARETLPEAVGEILAAPLGEDVRIPQVPPVVVKTRDEVGDVVEALNTVQASALDLAIEQAVLRRNIADSFVNLGRRNQNLLGRQLDFITSLEAHEVEPDVLDSLFRLDHLATRMRRNAESLLVLAGVKPRRRWASPQRVIDVIKAALGEVEDYQRVLANDIEPATVAGASAADLSHLLAEFVENALVFSPPDRPVEVRGRRRSDGGYTLAVADGGHGMPNDELAQANRRLAGDESHTVAPSKYLGHYVAGRLAERLGIRLHLEPSTHRGLTAFIELPPHLLADTAVPTRPGAAAMAGAGHGQMAPVGAWGEPSGAWAPQPSTPVGSSSPWGY